MMRKAIAEAWILRCDDNNLAFICAGNLEANPCSIPRNGKVFGHLDGVKRHGICRELPL